MVSLGCQEDRLLTCASKNPSHFLQSCYLASHYPDCTGACSYFALMRAVYPVVQTAGKRVKLPVLMPEEVHH